MQRTASCCCGSLKVTTAGEPAVVSICHCSECQRRSGSVFGTGAYFLRSNVRCDGPSTTYARAGQQGRRLTMHFCPTCGSTVYWELDLRPDHFGVAVGCFVDPSFPPPQRSVFEVTRHRWVATEHEIVFRAQRM